MAQSVVTHHQPSFTEWFAAIGKTQTSEALRQEDNTRTARLETLFQIIGLPYERPTRFPARALIDQSPEFLAFLHERCNDLCAIRLVPKNAELPKLRNRGLTLGVCYKIWFLKQEIDPDLYTAEIYPHTDRPEWSAIFIVNAEAIFGEIVRGIHAQLTHGETTSKPTWFVWDYQQWHWVNVDHDAKIQIERMVERLHIADRDLQRALREQLGAEFSHDHLCGYFESTVWPGDELHFIDYNRLLGARIPTPPVPRDAGTSACRGMTAYAGLAMGRVVIVTAENLDVVVFPVGSILVCDNTDVRFLPFMRKAAAIVTDRGGLLSHPAIVAREFKIPCIVGTGNATAAFRTGDLVEVNANHGVVTVLERGSS